VNDHLGWAGATLHGVSRYFLNVVPHLEPLGVAPVIIILRARDELARPFEEQGLSVRFLGYRRLDPRALFALWRAVRREKLDVLHAQGYASTTLARMLKLLTGVGVVIHSHDADDRYPGWFVLPDRLLAGTEDAALANSLDSLEFFEERRKVPAGSTELLYNGLDLEALRHATGPEVAALRKELDLPAEAEVVLTMTRFRPEKGNTVLVRAVPALVARRPQAVVLFAGDGPELGECRRLAADLGVETAVRFLGFRNDVPRLLSLASVAVVPSLREGTCYALLESLAMEVPTVASRVGGPAEILEDGLNGRLTPPGDAAALAGALADLLDDPVTARRLAETGRRRAGDFDVGHHVRRLETIYRRVTRRGSREAAAR
jgi:glycosyltransferase involved in cell wall biosynthesis